MLRSPKICQNFWKLLMILLNSDRILMEFWCSKIRMIRSLGNRIFQPRSLTRRIACRSTTTGRTRPTSRKSRICCTRTPWGFTPKMRRISVRQPKCRTDELIRQFFDEFFFSFWRIFRQNSSKFVKFRHSSSNSQKIVKIRDEIGF